MSVASDTRCPICLLQTCLRPHPECSPPRRPRAVDDDDIESTTSGDRPRCDSCDIEMQEATSMGLCGFCLEEVEQLDALPE